MNSTKSLLHSNWGTLYGLKPEDLTIEQIKKLDFKKLLEFLPTSSRETEEILCDKLNQAKVEELVRVSEAVEEIKQSPLFLQTYNNYIRKHKSKIRQVYIWDQSKIMSWELLDDDNRQDEYLNYLNNQSSILNDHHMDFEWLYAKNKELAEKLADKILDAQRGKYVGAGVANLIKSSPKELHLRNLLKINEKTRYVRVYNITNPHTPDDHLVNALREMNNITSIPTPTAKLTNKVLEELPPITRLNVMEKLIGELYYRSGVENIFVDLKTEEDLKNLLFSSFTKYHQRIKLLSDKYKHILERKNE